MPSVQPAIKERRDLRSAVSTAVVAMAGVSALSLGALWHNLPFSPAPNGGLFLHARYWGECAAHGGFSLISHGQSTLFADPCDHYSRYLAHLSDVGGLWGIGVRVAASAVLGVSAGTYTFSRGLMKFDKLYHHRGFRLLKGDKALRRAIQVCQEEIETASTPERSASDIRFHPKFRLSSDRASRHIAVIGATGGGKTQILRNPMKDIFAKNHRALIFDIKRDWTKFFPDAIIVAAADARGWAWDVGRDLRTESDADQFNELLIPESKDPFWSAAARAVLKGYLLKLMAERGADWGWKDLVEVLGTPDEEVPEIMRRYNPIALKAVEAAEAQGAPNQTAQSIRMTMQTYCAPLYQLARAWGDTPTERRWSALDWFLPSDFPHADGAPNAAQVGRRQVIMQGDLSREKLTHSYIAAVYSIVASHIGDLPEAADVPPREDGLSSSTFLVCDEFPTLGKVPAIELVISLGRSKDVRLLMGLQNVEQLQKIYDKETAANWMSQMGTTIVCRVSPGATATAVREMVGKKEVERENLSVSTGASGNSQTVMTSRDEMAVLYESELSDDLGLKRVRDANWGRYALELFMPRKKRRMKKVIRAVILGMGDALMVDWPITRLKEKRDAFVPAPWTFARPVAIEYPGDVAAAAEKAAAQEKAQEKKPLTEAERVAEEHKKRQDAEDARFEEAMEEAARQEGMNSKAFLDLADKILDTDLDPQLAEYEAEEALRQQRVREAADQRAGGADAEFGAQSQPVVGLFSGTRAGGGVPEMALTRDAELNRESRLAARHRDIHETFRGAARARSGSGLMAEAPHRSGIVRSRDPNDDSGLSDGAKASSRADTNDTAPQTSPQARGVDGDQWTPMPPDENFVEAAHGAHEVAETIGREFGLDEHQTDHLGFALTAAHLLDSVLSKDDQGAHAARQLPNQRTRQRAR